MCRCTGWAFPRCAYVLPTYRACTSILPVPPACATLEPEASFYSQDEGAGGCTHTHLGTPGRQPWHGCCSVVDRAAADRAALALTRSTREIGPGGPLCSADRAVPNGTEQLVGGCKTCRVGKQGTQFRDLSLEPSVLLC